MFFPWIISFGYLYFFLEARKSLVKYKLQLMKAPAEPLLQENYAERGVQLGDLLS